jgi:hypothetical protein
MAKVHSDISCCGIKELDDISGYRPETILADICQEWFDNTPRAFMFFSCTTEYVSGHNLAKYVKENGLGKVFKMPTKLNPNSGNHIRVWMWAVNNSKLKSLAKKKGWYSQPHWDN